MKLETLIPMTQGHMDEARSIRGSYSERQLKLLGLSYSHLPPRGWQKRMIGTLFPFRVIAEFIALKDKHLKAPT